MSAPEDGAGAGAGRPRTSPLLVVSLVLSALSLALPTRIGPLGPFAAGILAFLGYRSARASKGAVRGPGLALVAMTAALALFVALSWILIRGAPAAAAWTAIRERIARVDSALRTGTPEGTYDLLSPQARGAVDRAAFVAELRTALSSLGPLETLGPARETGGDWERTGSFVEGDAGDLRLPMALDSTFRRGRGRIELEVVVRRRGRAVTAEITALRVAPLGR